MPDSSSLPTPLAPFDALRVWARGEQRAPHKPLLVLHMLGRWVRGERDPVAYEALAPALHALLKEFGPDSRAYHPENPFWHLRSDGVWLVRADEALFLRVGGGSPSKGDLTRNHARGFFTSEVARAFEERPELVLLVARRLLEAHFPASIHEDLLAAVGLDLDEDGPGDPADLAGATVETTRRARDPGFRPRVIAAYEGRCAVCGLDLRIGQGSLGLEAAHIRWHQAGGPDTESNGLALCTLHHKVFDRGAFTVDAEGLSRRLLVSDAVQGGPEAMERVLLQHHGRPIRAPIHAEHAPDGAHLAWHRSQVFRGRVRPMS